MSDANPQQRHASRPARTNQFNSPSPSSRDQTRTVYGAGEYQQLVINLGRYPMVHGQGTYLVGLMVIRGRSALKTAGPSAELTTTRYNSTPLRWSKILPLSCPERDKAFVIHSKAIDPRLSSPRNSASLSCLPRMVHGRREGGWKCAQSVGLQISRQRLARTREPLSCYPQGP